MKKIISILLLFSVVVSFIACGSNGEVKELTCDEIVKAYEEAGYYVTHGEHCGEEGYHYRCYIVVKFNEEDNPADYIYFTTYWNEEEAQKATEIDKYHIVKWIFALPFGEYRWLKAKTYGKISYSYYNSEMVKPFNELIK